MSNEGIVALMNAYRHLVGEAPADKACVEAAEKIWEALKTFEKPRV